MRLLVIFLIGVLLLSCKQSNSKKTKNTNTLQINEVKSDSAANKKSKSLDLYSLPDTLFVKLSDYSDAFVYDLRYATTNNFLKTKVYDCPECYVRVATAKALLNAAKDFAAVGLKIKFFDCYRPNSVQWKMWEIVPNPQYVANPAKGSIHNKGGAVDITLVDEKGDELPMGTDFDYFGPPAHHDYKNLPEEVLANRKLLKTTMEKHGFWSIRTEWWHYNLHAASNYSVADFKWECAD